MNIEEVAQVAFTFALVIHLLLLVIAAWRALRGENAVDRLLSVELVSILILCIVLLATLITGQTIYLDVAMGLAALSFIGTLALARYLADQNMF